MKLKITKGDWEVEKSIAYTFIGKHGNRICMINHLEDGNPDHEANAQLIADAGTTANKCQLLPSELLVQRDELLEALQNCQLMISRISNIDGGRNIGKSMIMKQFLENENAINKTKAL